MHRFHSLFLLALTSPLLTGCLQVIPPGIRNESNVDVTLLITYNTGESKKWGLARGKEAWVGSKSKSIRSIEVSPLNQMIDEAILSRPGITGSDEVIVITAEKLVVKPAKEE